jgi:gluconate 2-dehydrogenase gamma chain
MTFISRRDLLKRIAVATPGTAPFIATPVIATPVARAFQPRDPARVRSPERLAVQAREPLENLTASEMDILEAIVARLIPADANGPGAAEARAAHYIDRALGSALASSREAYTAGLAAIDQYARSSRRAAFTALPPTDQDAVLVDIEKGTATGFAGSSTAFFDLVLSHTHQGTFGDPYYGGNAHFVGWDLIGYPGVRTMVSATDQKRLEANDLKPNHKSAYDYDGFAKAGGD